MCSVETYLSIQKRKCYNTKDPLISKRPNGQWFVFESILNQAPCRDRETARYIIRVRRSPGITNVLQTRAAAPLYHTIYTGSPIPVSRFGC